MRCESVQPEAFGPGGWDGIRSVKLYQEPQEKHVCPGLSVNPLCPSLLSSLHSHSSDGKTEDQMKIFKSKLVNREQGFKPSLLGSKQAPLDIIQTALTGK